ncbi:hypothetical protein H257_02976 [Aphanomyces astaci]|uniref:Myb/SANT-like domain-containing protein n=1 Tax=Aphanomyces astaci TaxID=112090 RepID=W4GZI0_APHAT|nr:hypothetical protein H257_02976 [Aphanomyces astaci]ETV85130.1 hypothetical protein H257_02976 [Aphanomyces astaci]|eukprot:XP_009825148.1 hypothetical protein H257_02976 [Aphanomyces astaci]
MSSLQGIRATWTAERDEFIITALQVQVQNGRRPDSGFKKEAWAIVTSGFNDRFAVAYLVTQIKSLVQWLKKDYKDVKYLRDNSGFGWNSDQGLPTAPNDVWAPVLAAKPNCKKFRVTPFPLFDSLALLLDKAYADGRFSGLPPGVKPPPDARASEERSNSMALVSNSSSPLSSPNVTLPRCDRLRRPALSDIENESESNSEVESPPAKKMKKQPPKCDRRSAGAVIGDAISKLVDVEAAKVHGQSSPHDRVTAAIECLMDNYDELDGDDIVRLVDMMGEGFNATIFMALRGAARNAWVAKNVSINWFDYFLQ